MGGVREYCNRETVEGIETPTEKKNRKMPNDDTYKKILSFAQERGNRMSGMKGTCPQYLWIIMELAYLCRLRGIEVDSLTDANATKEGILSNRRKGSNDNITIWNSRLRGAWAAAIGCRQSIWDKRKSPIPIRPEDRFIFISTSRTPLSKSAIDTSWQRFIRMALEEKIIKPEERFSLHGLKMKGTTDTPGTKSEKLDASGHKTMTMLAIYDRSLPLVPAKGVEPPTY